MSDAILAVHPAQAFYLNNINEWSIRVFQSYNVHNIVACNLAIKVVLSCYPLEVIYYLIFWPHICFMSIS